MNRTPIVRPLSWGNAGINLLILACLMLAGWFVAPPYGPGLGAAVYGILSLTLRGTLARHHRRAIALCKRQQFERAIAEFEASFDFFRQNPWVDQWRAVTMLSAAGMSYREMALISLGFCHGQIGDGVKSRAHYEQCLREFPENAMAQCALRLMDAARNAPSDTT